MWEIYGEGGGQFTNLKDARDTAKEFSKQGNDYDGYTGEPGDVSIWKDGSLYFTYRNGKVVFDGWTLKQHYYKVQNLVTLEFEEVCVNKSLKLNHVYVLGDGRRVKPVEKLKGLTKKEEEPEQQQDEAPVEESLKNKRLVEAIQTHSKLNPALFEGDQLKEEVRVRLVEIADLFIENIQEDEIPLKVFDYWMVGSNAAYNYTKDSDIDIHIIVDMEVSANPYLLKLLYDYVKSNFNDKYDIMVKGHEVELYLEDIKTSAVTNGIYSLKQDKWVKVPTKQEDKDYNIEDTELYRFIYDKYDNLKDEDAEEFIDDLYLLRKESLAADGEFGEGNLIFKEFRNKGYLDDLKNRKYKYKSQELTLEQLQEEDTSHTKRNKGSTRDKQDALVNKYVQAAVDTLNYAGSKSDMEIELLDSEVISTNNFMLDFEDAMYKRGIGYSIEEKQRFEVDNDNCTYFYLYIYRREWFNDEE